MPASRRQEASKKAVSFLLSRPLLTLIGSYVPLNSELDLTPFNHTLAKQGKLALPRVEEGSLVYYLIQDLQTCVQKSDLHVFEPIPEKTKRVNVEDLSLLLVPGLAFDVENYRLGRGKGYYDRTLSLLDAPSSLALAFKEQKCPELLPREKHDRPVDQVVYF